MNVPGFSTNGLVMMHDAIKRALAEDDRTLSHTDKPYGVRSFADWKSISDAIEAELNQRGVIFEPVPW
jgi:hypothetical protein